MLTGIVKTDSIEAQFNILGKDRWELVTAVVIDGIQNSMYHKDDCTIEYVFKRKL